VELALSIGAKPKAHVAYRREAWVQPDDNSIRVTMDRDVICEVDESIDLKTEATRPFRVFGNRVVLELKFTGRFPDWFGQLVRIFDLHQGPAAKYADGVALMGENRFSPHGAVAPNRQHARRRAARIRNLMRECEQGPGFVEAVNHV
jgi:hypothetical protein